MCYLCDERERANTMVPTTVEAPKEEVKEAPASRTLTREMVMKGDPCGYYRRQFVSRFPESVEVTEGLAVSQAKDWDWFWAAENLLSYSGYVGFKELVREVQDNFNKTLAPYRNTLQAMRQAVAAEQQKLHDELVDAGVSRWTASDKAWDLYYSILNNLGDPNLYGMDVMKAAEEERIKGQARAWAQVFLSDKDAYEEQHKNDEPFEDGWTELVEDYAEEEG